jgi:putative ABC transport system permease protein
MASRELFMVVQPYSPVHGGYIFLQVRGITDLAFRVHSEVRIVAGRDFRPGRRELVIGRSIQRAGGPGLGEALDVGGQTWRVVGVFEAAGASFESEVWCDLSELSSLFRSEGMYSSIVLRAGSEADAAAIAERLERAQHITVRAFTEPEYYAGQSENLRLVELAVLAIAIVMGSGSVFAIMNTMFASIAQRTRDIALMRLLGFHSMQVLAAFLLEALLIAAAGGALGTAIGYAANGFSQKISLGTHELAFAFRVDAAVLAVAGVFTLTMGIAGGVLPALAAVRVNPLDALR